MVPPRSQFAPMLTARLDVLQSIPPPTTHTHTHTHTHTSIITHVQHWKSRIRHLRKNTLKFFFGWMHLEFQQQLIQLFSIKWAVPIWIASLGMHGHQAANRSVVEKSNVPGRAREEALFAQQWILQQTAKSLSATQKVKEVKCNKSGVSNFPTVKETMFLDAAYEWGKHAWETDGRLHNLELLVVMVAPTEDKRNKQCVQVTAHRRWKCSGQRHTQACTRETEVQSHQKLWEMLLTCKGRAWVFHSNDFLQ